jgi:hypothetical protein
MSRELYALTVLQPFATAIVRSRAASSPLGRYEPVQP